MHLLWYGVLAGMIVWAVAPGWLKVVAIGLALVLSGLLVQLPVHPHGHIRIMPPTWLIAVAGVVFGIWAWHRARLRGLEHLGSHELRSRWAAVRGVSKW